MIDLGIVKPGTTLYIPFATYDSNDPTASVTTTGLAVTDIEIYKNGGTTARASDSGYTLLGTDGIDEFGTGIHGFSINLADNTTGQFYQSGSQYWVVVASITVDSGTINFIAATFRIGYPDAAINTYIATYSSQTSFTLNDGPAEDDALNGCVVIVHDVASAVQLGLAVISDYTGSSKTVTLTAATTFTIAQYDNIAIFPAVNPKWFGAFAVTGRDIGASVLLSSGSGTGQLDFTSGVVKANATQFAGQTITCSGGVTIPAATLASTANITSAAGCAVTSIAAGAITATVIATGAIDADAIADGAIDAGAIADGSFTAVKFADNFLTAAKINAGAIDADAIATDAVTEIQSGLATATELAKVPKSDGTATWNATALAAINAEVDTALNTAIPASNTANSVNDILLDVLTIAGINATVDTAISDAALATSAELAKVPKSDGTATWNATALAAIQSECDDALVANHLDHLFKTAYDPASKPGSADALLNEVIGNDAGVAQFTANALELAPTDGSAPTAADIANAVWDEVLHTDHEGAGSASVILQTINTNIPEAIPFTDHKVDANASITLTPENITDISEAIAAELGDPKEQREGNMKKTFTLAAAENATRKVGIGKIDYVKIETKADTAADWAAPTSTKYLYFWYSKIGDVNPFKIGENNT